MKNANDTFVVTSPEYRNFIEDLKERESFRVTLVELRDKIDSFLSPSPALA